MLRTPLRHARLDARATLLGILLAGILVLAGLLAREAHRATRSHAAATQRALASYASVAAWSFRRGVEEEVDVLAGDAFAPVTAVRAATPFEHLAPPQALLVTFGDAFGCPTPGVPRRLARVDLRDGSLVVHGDSLPAADARWIADTIVADVAAAFEPGRRAAVVLGTGSREHLAIVYGVRLARYGAPVAAYALVTCRDAFSAPLFDRVVARHALLPDAGREADNASLVAVAVLDRDGRAIWRSAGDPADTTGVAATVALARTDGLRVHAALRPSATRHLTSDVAPRARIGVLVALLALTIGLAAVAIVQLRREQELARLRADFTSSVSHELRTPLAQILLFGETLSLDRVRTAEERRLAADTIVQEAKRLMHMVDNVLHFARAERGVVEVAPRAVTLAPVVRGTVAAFAPLAEGMRLHEALDEGLVALADVGAVRQVLLNLLDNAVKYGAPGQTIRVGLQRAGAYARLVVEDEGTGVPAAERERGWEPYVRMARHQGAARGGSGIGLAVVRELVLLHGGHARVEDAPGGGARFVVELPLVAPVVDVPASPAVPRGEVLHAAGARAVEHSGATSAMTGER